VARTESLGASAYANRLLADLGVPLTLRVRAEPHPGLRWAQCGAMALTGYPHEPPQMCPVPLASYADGIVAALAALRPQSAVGQLDGAQLLAERAALANYRRGGDVAAGGSCRLLALADGWLAVNLARVTDWQLLPAWLETEGISDWATLGARLSSHRVEPCVERGRLVGLALAPLRQCVPSAPSWCRELYRGPHPRPERLAAPLVLDLSSLWAGPLCAHLLQLMGARVIKVESSARPDGMRQAGGFYDLLNAGKASVALDLGQPRARAQLRQLLLRADIVIEASRPRALRQLGIVAEEILEENPAATWIGISGYGREEPGANWVAFGDDGAVAGGLSQVLWDCTGRAMFCADALADPLTGLHAALAAWGSFVQGGGRLISLALAEVVAYAIARAALTDPAARRARAQEWSRALAHSHVAAPRARLIPGPARALGADTTEILCSLGSRF
jgi:crotonobetainyl-CoA:carnitine CoA-transferase CaiB-like acyl-CoA transferase